MEAEFAGATTPAGGHRKRKAQGDLRRPQRSSGSSSSERCNAATSSVYKARTTDFRVLAEAVYTNNYGSASIDWKDPYAAREVTYALLKNDFDLELDIPIDQLCPPVPNRANYIYWLRDLLHRNSPQLCTGPDTRVRGLDIGTGASCIYPLLGAKIHGWSFVATDIDETSLRHARHNVALNRLEATIELRQSRPDDLLLGALRPGEELAFSMCNPPFFAHLEEACQNPRTVCTGTPNELVTAGGEVQFVERMINESLVLRHTIRWYTSMLGKKSDLNALLKTLAAKGIVNVHTTTFYQGKTTRWGLAWSLTQDGLEDRAKAKALEKLRGKDEVCFAVSANDPSALLAHVNELFRDLGLALVFCDDPFRLRAEATQYTWRRRRREEKKLTEQAQPANTAPLAHREGGGEEPERYKASALTREEETAEALRLAELQVYLGQYEQVTRALEDDPGNAELLEARSHLEEFVSLTHQLWHATSLETTTVASTTDVPLPRPPPVLAAPDGDRATDFQTTTKPDPAFQFQVQVMQTQGPVYMLQFSWVSGASKSKMAFHELFDYLKHAITTKFPRA
ncbi:uncharacterized protein ACA1_142640 [Acanthamoeba castellanii str. Neff]|uniref:U6 small nuclear RNA (adenine-(43)-N(6))-methyltransferase n=1 Tax=Acanthamoeba castellanii (strain ATCC 30010 / Neff) TaxID=1257118 RepID=L8HDV1_ACACF|nr:uncharacterized protein ACA1_142640 [Acanthamoeba castellanii str. Neff]ELR22561.1 hypothetical protein ACA1_142640 [Acanthamoeba castellanii str. Neff]